MRTPTDPDLRSLDAADAALDPGQRSRADAMLERIIAQPVAAENAPVGARRQRRISGKVIWVPLVTAAVAVGSIVIPAARPRHTPPGRPPRRRSQPATSSP